jgi:hypothetical protein
VPAISPAKRLGWAAVAAVLGAFAFAAGPASAETLTGSGLSIVVTGSPAAVMPGAEIAWTHTATNVSTAPVPAQDANAVDENGNPVIDPLVVSIDAIGSSPATGIKSIGASRGTCKLADVPALPPAGLGPTATEGSSAPALYPDGADCEVGVLDPGASVTVTITIKLGQAERGGTCACIVFSAATSGFDGPTIVFDAKTAVTSPQSSGAGAAPGCVVPKLAGKKLAAARTALKKAHCALGKVTRKRSAKKAGTVTKQSVKAGRPRPAGTKVNVTLARR